MRRTGPRAAIILSQQQLKPSGSSTGLPSAFLHSLQHTGTTIPPTPLLLSAQAPVFSPLLPDDASTSLGCRAEKSPWWQPFKPPSLQHGSQAEASTIRDRGPNWSCDMLSDESKKHSTLQELIFSSIPLLMIENIILSQAVKL